jgi:hypothetical protein
MNDEETRKYVRCPSKLLKARIICTTTCKDRHCLYHPNYRERVRSRSRVKRDLPIPFIDGVEPIKSKGIKASRKKGVKKCTQKLNSQ